MEDQYYIEQMDFLSIIEVSNRPYLVGLSSQEPLSSFKNHMGKNGIDLVIKELSIKQPDNSAVCYFTSKFF